MDGRENVRWGTQSTLDFTHRDTFVSIIDSRAAHTRSTAGKRSIDTSKKIRFVDDRHADHVPDSTTTSASPLVTLSPGAFSQETILPSVIVDDRAGMKTSFTAFGATFLLFTVRLLGRVIFNERFIVKSVN